MSYRLGVDLGTTWTAAAIADGSHVAPLPLSAQDALAIPSVVALVDGQLVAGEDAEAAGVADPTAVAREFKRRFGDASPIVLGSQAFAVMDLSAALLAKVIAVATEVQGAPPDHLTLTHPAAWEDFKLDELAKVAASAGVPNVDLVPEPVAAASHYVRLGRVAPGDVVAVYDLGGGTFDAAVVRAADDGPVLMGPAEGIEHFGGIDLDAALLAHVNEACDGKLAELDSSDPDTMRALVAVKAACTKAKEALSADTDAVIPVTVPGLSTEVRVTRAELEEILRPRLTETLNAFDRACAAAKVTPDDLVGSLLVGGGSRVPLVGETLEQHTSKPAFIDADPKLVVALGAAGGPPLAGEMAAPTDASVAANEDGSGRPATTGAGEGPDGAGGGSGRPAGAVALRASATTAAARAEQRRRMAMIGGSILGVAAVGVAGVIAYEQHDFDKGHGPGSAAAAMAAAHQHDQPNPAHPDPAHHATSGHDPAHQAPAHQAPAPHEPGPAPNHEPAHPGAAPAHQVAAHQGAPAPAHQAAPPAHQPAPAPEPAHQAPAPPAPAGSLADAFDQVAPRPAAGEPAGSSAGASMTGSAPHDPAAGGAAQAPASASDTRQDAELTQLRNEVEQLAAAGRAEASAVSNTDAALRILLQNEQHPDASGAAPAGTAAPAAGTTAGSGPDPTTTMHMPGAVAAVADHGATEAPAATSAATSDPLGLHLPATAPEPAAASTHDPMGAVAGVPPTGADPMGLHTVDQPHPAGADPFAPAPVEHPAAPGPFDPAPASGEPVTTPAHDPFGGTAEPGMHPLDPGMHPVDPGAVEPTTHLDPALDHPGLDHAAFGDSTSFTPEPASAFHEEPTFDHADDL